MNTLRRTVLYYTVILLILDTLVYFIVTVLLPVDFVSNSVIQSTVYNIALIVENQYGIYLVRTYKICPN